MRFSLPLTPTRILFLGENQVNACLRDRRGLTFSARFWANEQGYQTFSEYLATPPAAPLYLVADLIEEEFHLETVPHALGSDRRSLWARKLGQLFRNTTYRQAQLQGREREGRRDDRVLFSALTGSEQLRPWLERILAAKAPLAGITSAALLSEALAAHFPSGKKDHLLLVSHQEESGLRQSYLRAGRLQFSRLTNYVPPPGEGESDLLANTLIEECFRTRQYLERQRLLSHQQELEILVLAEPAEFGRLRMVESSSPLSHFLIHNLGFTAARLGLPLPEGLGIAALALIQLQPGGQLPNHYAPATLRRYHHIGQFRQGLRLGAALLLLATLQATFALLSTGLHDRRQQLQLRRESLQLRQTAEEQRQQFPPLPVPAASMKKSVQTVESIRRIPSPLELLAWISRALDRSPELQIHRLAWSLTAAATPGKPGEDQNPAALPLAPALLPAIALGKTETGARLEGHVHPFDGQRAAYDSIQKLLAALTAQPGLTATLIEEPLTTRPDKGISARVGGSESEPGFILKLSRPVTP